MASIELIDEQNALDDLVAELRQGDWVSLDTEFVRERTYFPQLGLIQVASASVAACIDPIAAPNLDRFGELLSSGGVTKILHSCRQDLEALDTCTEFRFQGLYDTQIAAAFCGYGDQLGYAALVKSVCGVELPKTQTRTDWTRRPLSREQLEYAMDDVRYLQDLRQTLDQQLDANGRLGWFEAECTRAVDPGAYQADPKAAWVRLKGGAALAPAQQHCARQLAIWREERAIKRDRPRGWILPTPVLLEVSRRMPQSLDALAAVKGMPEGTVRHAGRQILSVVRECAGQAVSEPVWRGGDALEPVQKKRVKDIMALLRERAEQAGISASLIANRDAVEHFVRGDTGGPLFSGWRAELLGNEILTNFG